MYKRVKIILTALTVLFAGITSRLIQLGNSTAYSVASSYTSRVQTFAVSRGTVYDRYGQPLVNAETEWAVSIAPFESCVREIRAAFSKSKADETVDRLLKGERVVCRLSQALPEMNGIAAVKVPKRYDDRALACHLIGYVNSDGNGVSGIEKAYNELLREYGGEATVSYEVDATGRVGLNTSETVTNTLERCRGGVVTTLDAQIQELVQRAATPYLERGAVVVLSADNAQILASVSVPVYNPNAVEMYLETPSSPLLDRTKINYNLGSVFKVIVAAAALENGFDAGTTYTCDGAVDVNGTVFHCHNREGDGAQTMVEAMSASCNCYFIRLALDVGEEALLSMATKAGFSDLLTLGDGMATTRALLPSAFDLSAGAALANFAIGQGSLMATPYHVAALYKAIADGGVYESPSLILGTTDENGVIAYDDEQHQQTRLFSEETADVLNRMLCGVVASGTGVGAMPKQGVAAGKTGTAETGWEIDGEDVVQSWFAGYYPANDPQYVVVVLSENGANNRRSAAPLFADVVDALCAEGLVS